MAFTSTLATLSVGSVSLQRESASHTRLCRRAVIPCSGSGAKGDAFDRRIGEQSSEGRGVSESSRASEKLTGSSIEVKILSFFSSFRSV